MVSADSEIVRPWTISAPLTSTAWRLIVRPNSKKRETVSYGLSRQTTLRTAGVLEGFA